jgi:hypothetical protein
MGGVFTGILTEKHASINDLEKNRLPTVQKKECGINPATNET